MKITQRLLTKHYTSPRRDKIRFVIVHHMTIIGNGKGAANDACYRVWQTRQASAHYGVDGAKVTQFVRDGDAAWAAGNSTGNHAGISIEHANSTAAPHWRISETTWRTGARLAALLHVRHGLGRPVSGKTLRKHSEFTATACPGPFMDSIWSDYVREAQREYDRLVRKPRKLRVGSWNLCLHDKRRLNDRLRRISRKVRKARLNVLFTQENPRNPGKQLDGQLGDLTVRVGGKARYIYFESGTKIHGSATWNPWPKNKRFTMYVTTACATVPGDRKRFYVNLHAPSGNVSTARDRERWNRAALKKSIRRAKKHGLGLGDMVIGGDANGPELAKVAKALDFGRARGMAKHKGLFKRTYNAWGKRNRTDKGGQLDYFIFHKSMRAFVHRARVFWTWLASDHCLTITEIRE